MDLIVEVPHLPTPGQTVPGRDLITRPGGKGANQAVAAHRQGATTTFVGALGRDEFGERLRRMLHAEGIDTSQVVAADAPTGTALIFVGSDARNMIVVAAGANGKFTEEHLDGLQAFLTPATVLMLQLEVPLATSLAAARQARAAGSTVMLNASPAGKTDDPELRPLLELTDILVVNRSETLELCATAAPSTVEGWQSLALQLTALGPTSVIVTLDDAGAVLATSGATLALPAHRVAAIDTTGAGDAFSGAVAAAVTDNASLEEAVRRGCAAGALATIARGAQSALPTLTDVEQLLAAESGTDHVHLQASRRRARGDDRRA